ncbi:MAG: LysR family transcriptional regulator [Caulobacteraceae bacterium]|nr:LysR family transcriptional regulator [Caulobacteraceae bacterium]
MIDRYQLGYFLAVVEAGNFSRAAAQVNVTQPTLSVGIAKLEQSLGVKLFLRNSQRVQLTEAGVRFMVHARAIEREFNAIEIKVAGPQPARLIRLGVLGTIPTPMIEQVVAANRRAGEPDRLEIVEGSERDLLGRLQQRRLDVALTLIRFGETRFTQVSLFQEGYSLAVPLDHPLAGAARAAAEDLAQDVMIVRRHCEVLSATSRHFTERGVRPAFSLRTTNDDKAVAMVRAGLGITVMPDSYRDPGLARIPLDGFDAQREIGLLYADHAEDLSARRGGVMAALRGLSA